MKRFISKHMNSRYFDYAYNILASFILTAATQLLAYPLLGRTLDSAQYGAVLTAMGLFNLIGVSLGNPLNNARLLLQREYEEENLVGDYNLLFLGCAFLSVPVTFVVSRYALQFSAGTSFNCIWIVLLIMFRAYYSVGYRIWINFKRAMLVSIFALFGYLFGSVLIICLHADWSVLFISGELAACLYVLFTCGLLREPLHRTPLFGRSFSKFAFMAFSTVLATGLTYADRFFIYPILGADSVSVYNTASFLGKMAGIVMTPISGVLLTYYAKENRITLRAFLKRLLIYTAAAAVLYVGILVFGPWVSGLLYPTLWPSAREYMPVANLSTTVAVLSSTIMPTMLCTCSEKWQPVVQMTYLAAYLAGGLFCMGRWGLAGYCWAVLLVNILKTAMIVSITCMELKKHPPITS